MMTVRLAAVAIVIMILGSSPVSVQVPTVSRPSLPVDVRLMPDLVYTPPGRPALRLDLFSPRQGGGPLPAVVFLHGGGFPAPGAENRAEESKSQFWPQSAYLAARGIIAATIQYGLAPAPRFPKVLNDVQAAVRWLRSHAQELKIDPRRIAIVGGSSGGHLAALIGVNQWNGSDWSGTPADARVQAAVAFNGNFDLPKLATATDASAIRSPSGLTVVETSLRNFLGAPFDQDPALWRAASPISHVSSQAAPFLLLHGTEDTTVPYGQSLEMQRKLSEAGVRVDLFTADGAAHGFFNGPPWYEQTTSRLVEFLRSVMK